MSGANSNIQLSGLDFNDIKTNLKTFLQGQDTFKDYNFEGAGLSVLLDILAYNTQYNAFYLNMVANEMFFDTALQRSSVVSQAKLLDYTPQSAKAPTATVNIYVTGVNSSSLTLPSYSNFLSESVKGANYNFITMEDTTVNVANNIALFTDVEISQGILGNYSYVVDSTSNPSFTFTIPDADIDTQTLKVLVQKSSSNSYFEVFTRADNYLTLDGNSQVYFLQEGINGKYEIYFGDGIIGKSLINGNVVKLSYLITQSSASEGANNFVMMDNITGFENVTVYGKYPAGQSKLKESIDSIKFQAPKSYAAQGRAVTKEDYISAIQRNSLGIGFDAINVWGGEENDTPIYGQVFISLKPTGSYNLTETQKQRIINEVIKPVSVMTVTPTLQDPDYTYIKLNVDVYYDPTKTNQTSSQIKNGVKTSIYNFANRTLNTFNSTFNVYELLNSIQSYSSSIITSEYDISLQKKIFPNLTTPTKYNLYYNSSLERGMFLSGINSSPALQYRNPNNLSNTIDGVYIEEVPESTNEIDSISIINPGYGYQSTPTITILGDGTGATANAVIVNGSIQSVVVTNPGSGYTSAIATVTPAVQDTTGKLGSLVVHLKGRYGTLRTYYNNTQQVKTILNSNVGTVDYKNGVITLNALSPINVDNDLGQLTITAKPTTSIISSTYNRIITIDPYDPNAVTVNVIAKSSK